MHGSRSTTAPPAPWQDVRLAGFAARVELDLARARLDAMLPPPALERRPLGQALGRVLAVAATAAADVPAQARARHDGYALAAAATFGASTYNPLALGAGCAVAAGEAMPAGADAILPFVAVAVHGGTIEVSEPVAPGQGVLPAGFAWRCRETIVPAGRRLSALDLARAAEAGLDEVELYRRPEVRVLVAGAKAAVTVDPLALLLAGLIARDGGSARPTPVGPDLAATLPGLLPADLVLVVGRSGTGADDDAAPALAGAGQVELHGVAMAPGGSAGLGRLGAIPVVLLPGEPLACLAAYELLAGGAVRRLAGLPPDLPHPRRRLRLRAKIASQVGTTELWLVRQAGSGCVPLAGPGEAVLATTGAASGFVIVPASSEGYPVDSEVEVHLLDG